MSWARLDDQFWSNPKIVAAGNESAGIFARALSYCAANETNGFVPMTIARTIASRLRARERLEMNQLWTKVTPGDRFTITGRKDSGRRKLPDVTVTVEADGYYIRDYLHYNRARTDARANESASEISSVRFERANERADEISKNAHKDARAALPYPTQPLDKPPSSSTQDRAPTRPDDDDGGDLKRRLEEAGWTPARIAVVEGRGQLELAGRWLDAALADPSVDNPGAYAYTMTETGSEPETAKRASIAPGAVGTRSNSPPLIEREPEPEPERTPPPADFLKLAGAAPPLTST